MPVVTVVEVGAEGLLLRNGDGEPESVAADLELDSVEVLAAALDPVLERAGVGPGRSVDVLLHPPYVQVRTLRDLPPVGRRDLIALVENQATRFFRPIDGATVVSAERVGSGADAVVCAILAPLELLERLEAALLSGRRRVRRFLPVRGGEAWPELLTPRARRAVRKRLLLSGVAAVGVGAAAWAAAGATYLLDLRADSRAVAVELAQLEAPLERIDALSDRLAAFAPIADAVRGRSGDAGWLFIQLDGLARSLPADTHLHALSAERGGAIVLEAHGPSALGAVAAFEGWWAGLVRLDGAPEPDASTQEGDAALERFTVVLEEAQ